MLSGVFLYKNLIVCRFYSLVFRNRFGKLIGTGGVELAFNSCKKGLYFVDMSAFDKTGYALQVAAATADKANAMKKSVFVNVEKNLSGTSAFGGISEHK